MEVKIGIRESGREIAFDSPLSPDELAKQLETAIDEQHPGVKLSDERGRIFLVPTSAIAYVEIGAAEARRIGFVS